MAFLMIEIMELLCTRFPLLISLTELAVGFGRKRDALDWDTAHGETLHIHPKDSKKESNTAPCIKIHPKSIQDQDTRQYRFPRSP